MHKHSPTVEATQPQIDPTGDAFERLTSLGWSRSLLAIVAGLVVSFLLFGYALVYWRNADMDFMVIYSALAMNDGKPQQFLDHTAYLTILSVKSWFQLLHGVGLLDASTLSAIPPASDASGFDAAMTHAVRAGRVLALLIATGCVLIFAGLARRIFRDWRVALIATLAFALSGGIAVHSRMLRSELVAAVPVIFALMILIVVGRSASLARPLGLAIAAALCVHWPGKQGAGHPSDRDAASRHPAVWKRGGRKRCVLARSARKLACHVARARNRSRHDRRGVAADYDRP